ncbi:homeobox KN domain-containing protein, partial [Peziza echinospora]
KRRRGNLPKPVTDMLRAWLSSHVAHPYPTEEEKIQLCDATNLTMNQISNWFINARRRRLNQRSDDPAQPRRPSPPRQNPSVGHG